jgi:APA family basic amino acid/polyamine antiporter
MLAVGAVVGVGIYTLMGITAAKVAGPAIVVSFLFAGICCGFAALCYAELASMVPIAGSAYTYAYTTMGELLAWVLGWDLILEYSVGAAAVAISASDILVAILHQVFGLTIPPAFSHSIFDASLQHGGINAPAAIIVISLSALLYRGIQESANTNTTIVFVKLAVIVSFIVWGARTIKLSNYTPFIPPNHGDFGIFGWSGVLHGAGILYFAYIGFDSISTAAEEATNPKRDVPIALLAGLTICTILYIAFAVVLTGNIRYTDLQTGTLGNAYNRLFPNGVALFLNAGTFLGLTSGALIMLIGQSRVIYSISRDGLLPPLFSEIHPVFRTPTKSTIASMIAVGTLAAFAPLRLIAEITSIGTLLTFTIVCAAVLILRETDPGRPRNFRVPLSPYLPILGILVNLTLMIFLGSTNWLRLSTWLVVGMIIYFAYGAHRSRLAVDDSAAAWRIRRDP